MNVPRPAEFAIRHDRWLIVGILCVQAALSTWLVRANTAFQDEGLYLWAGYLQNEHHAGPGQIQWLESWFSGAPVIYPRLGALAARFAGIAGARLLSLVFMLLATLALYGVTYRIWSARGPAVFAAALFAFLGPTQFLGAFATYDAMSLALLAVAVWLGVRAVACRVVARLALLMAGAALLLLANATKYASALFDPVAVGVVFLSAWRMRGWRPALASGFTVAAAAATLVFGAYHLAGRSYAAGIKFTTLSRMTGSSPPEQVLAASGRWIGLPAGLAIAGALAATRRSRDAATTLLVWLLASAAVLAPVQQARLHTVVSLYKHAAFGAWFASVPAGWLAACVFRHAAGRRAIAVLAVAVSTAIGTVTARTQYHNWPSSARVTSELTGLATGRGEYLAEDYDQFAYSLRRRILLPQWWNTWSFASSSYSAAIRVRRFSVIVLDFQDTIAADQAIERDIDNYRDYRLMARIPFTTSAGTGDYLVWVPIPRPPAAPARSNHATPVPLAANRR